MCTLIVMIEPLRYLKMDMQAVGRNHEVVLHFCLFYEKKNRILTSSSTSSKQKFYLFIYLEFHFTVKTKLVNNFVSFPMTIFQFFLSGFDMLI